MSAVPDLSAEGMVRTLPRADNQEQRVTAAASSSWKPVSGLAYEYDPEEMGCALTGQRGGTEIWVWKRIECRSCSRSCSKKLHVQNTRKTSSVKVWGCVMSRNNRYRYGSGVQFGGTWEGNREA